MDRFAQVSIYLSKHKFAYLCKVGHVYNFTNLSKLYSTCKVFSFALSGDQVQISVSIYAKFACEYFGPMICVRSVKCLQEYCVIFIIYISKVSTL